MVAVEKLLDSPARDLSREAAPDNVEEMVREWQLDELVLIAGVINSNASESPAIRPPDGTRSPWLVYYEPDSLWERKCKFGSSFAAP
jgi:hypothetical protein